MGRGEDMGHLTQPGRKQKAQQEQQEPLDVEPLLIRFLRTFREILKFVLFSYTVLFGALLLARWTTYFMVGKWKEADCWRMGMLSDLELIDEVDQADLLGICGLCSSYKSLVSPHTIITAGVIMFSALFNSHSAVELSAFVQFFFFNNQRVLQAYRATLQWNSDTVFIDSVKCVI